MHYNKVLQKTFKYFQVHNDDTLFTYYLLQQF